MPPTSNPYRSERLLYRAAQDDDMEIVDTIQNDGWAFGYSSFGVMKPQGPHELQQQKTALATQALLGVIICLPAPEPTEEQKKEAADGTPAKPAKPIPIGAIGLSAVPPHRSHHRESYISVDIIAAYRGKGYGSEAINWIVQWGFQIANLHRITIEAFSYNEDACRLYEKLGFVLEGRKRKSIWFNGEWHDHVTFGMLEDEWREKNGSKKF